MGKKTQYFSTFPLRPRNFLKHRLKNREGFSDQPEHSGGEYTRILDKDYDQPDASSDLFVDKERLWFIAEFETFTKINFLIATIGPKSCLESPNYQPQYNTFIMKGTKVGETKSDSILTQDCKINHKKLLIIQTVF